MEFFTILSVLIAIVVVFWATWVLIRRLWRGDPKRRSFKEWAKSVLDAIFSIG